MPDNPKKQALDRKLISLRQGHERAYWTARLNVTVVQLRIAIDAVGPSAKKVRAWLKENG